MDCQGQGFPFPGVDHPESEAENRLLLPLENAAPWLMNSGYLQTPWILVGSAPHCWLLPVRRGASVIGIKDGEGHMPLEPSPQEVGLDTGNSGTHTCACGPLEAPRSPGPGTPRLSRTNRTLFPRGHRRVQGR